MAAPLRLVLLWTIAIATHFHHADSKLSNSAAEFTALSKNQEATGKYTNDLLQNNTDKLDEMIAIMTRVEEFLQLQQQKQDQLNLSDQTHQNTVTQIANINSQTLSAVTQIVATQTRMAESLHQIVDLLQIKNQQSESDVSPQTENTADRQVQQQWTTLSPTPTIVETTNSEITEHLSIPIDCSNISATDNQGSEVYTIDPRDGLGSFQVYCNMDIDEGGSTVLQKRFDGLINFFLGWRDYKEGFGNMQGEHWLGLQQMHRLTSSGQWKLRIDMEDFDGNTGYAQYEDFQIGDEASFYQLSIGAYSGTAGYDSMAYHNGKPFSTNDRDHAICSTCESYDGSCALAHQGAWWYWNCFYSNLNGLYQGSTCPVPNDPPYNSVMCWTDFPGSGGYTPIKKSEMKMRVQ